MALWLVRGGKVGEREQLALSNGLATIGWEELPDLGAVSSKAELLQLMEQTYPAEKANTLANWAGQVWAFKGRIQVGDLVAMPLKGRSVVAVGRVTGDYDHRTNLGDLVRHVRPVEWIAPEIPRANFDQDLLFSLGAFMTVCQIQRGGAEDRVKALLSGTPPAPAKGTSVVNPATPTDSSAAATDDTATLDLEQYGRDLIRTHLSQKFKEHNLERLIGAILQAQGYQVNVTKPGADGGLDILAGRGAMGFEPPRLGVQVKSSDASLGVQAFRELQGVLTTFGADQGLLVSWGGFKSSVYEEARKKFFSIRLWDADDVVDALLDVYDRLSPEVQAEVPLKRVWTLVLEE